MGLDHFDPWDTPLVMDECPGILFAESVKACINSMGKEFCATRIRYFNVVTITLSHSLQQCQNVLGQGLCPYKAV